MTYLIALMFMLLFRAPGADAQTETLSGASVRAAGTTTSRTLAQRFTDVIHVKDFGAVCDNTADDTAAINAAFTHLRRTLTAGQTIPLVTDGHPVAKVVFSGGVCKITGPINVTGLKSYYLEIDGSGSALNCVMAGGVCFDALGSRFLRIRNLTIVGDPTITPRVGLQIGKFEEAPADNHTLDNVAAQGEFTLAACYVVGSETNLFTHLQCANYEESSGTYGLIMDGYNHFGVTSTFKTVTLPVDVAGSFNENTFVTPDIRATGSGVPIWFGGAARHKMIGGYLVSQSYGVVIYNLGRSVNNMLDLDIHMETTSITDAFYITGTNTAPIINGFSFRDHGFSGSNSIFKVDPRISTVSLRNADVRIGSYARPTTVLFDAPSKWSFYGTYASPQPASFNVPAQFQGQLIQGDLSLFGNYGTGYVSAQMGNNAVTGGIARGVNAVDWQSIRFISAQVAKGAASTVSGGYSNTAYADYSTVTGGQGNTASGVYSTAGGINNGAIGTASTVFGSQNSANGVGGAIPGGVLASDRGRYASRCFASGQFTAIGDAQTCQFVLRGTGSSTSAIRLTGDGAPAGSANVMNLANNSKMSTNHDVLIAEATTAEFAVCSLVGAGIRRGSNAADTAIAAMTFPTWVMKSASNATAAGWGCPTMTADTTNGGVNVSWTPPKGNTDTFYLTDRVDTVEIVK